MPAHIMGERRAWLSRKSTAKLVALPVNDGAVLLGRRAFHCPENGLQNIFVGIGTGERLLILVVGALVADRYTLLGSYNPRRSAKYFETEGPVLHFSSEGVYQKNSMGQSRLRLWPSTAIAHRLSRNGSEPELKPNICDVHIQQSSYR